jgi:SOS response regulatory protein OraA/RecX
MIDSKLYIDLVSTNRNYLLYLLSRRNYSRSQLERKLKLRKIASKEIEQLLNSLEAEKIFRPELHAESRLRVLARKGYSIDGIYWKLRSEGLKKSKDWVAQQFSEEGFDENQSLKQIIEKAKLPTKISTEDNENRADSDKKKQRLVKKAQSRGYTAQKTLAKIHQKISDGSQ